MNPIQVKIPYIGVLILVPDERLKSFFLSAWNYICTNLGKQYAFYLLGAVLVVALGISASVISSCISRRSKRQRAMQYRTPMVPKRKQPAYLPGMDVDKAMEAVRKQNPGATPPANNTASASAKQDVRFSNNADAQLPKFPEVPKGDVKKKNRKRG